jgi:hypothetical protein
VCADGQRIWSLSWLSQFNDLGKAFWLIVQLRQRLLDDHCEGIDFLRAQCVEDQAANSADMTRCCMLDGSATLRCDHNEGTAAVLGTLHALHQAPPFHASHVVGDSRPLPCLSPASGVPAH